MRRLMNKKQRAQNRQALRRNQEGNRARRNGGRTAQAASHPRGVRYNWLQYTGPPAGHSPLPMIPGLLRRQTAQALLLSLSLIALGAQADVYDDVERMVRNGQLDQATQLSAQHLQKSPQDPQMRLLSSRILDARGRTDEAVSVLESLTRDYPELPEPHNNLAVQYARLGRTQEALSSLQRAIQARPDYAVALENLGDLYVGMALQAYEQAHKAPTPSVSAGRKAETLSPVLRR